MNAKASKQVRNAWEIDRDLTVTCGARYTCGDLNLGPDWT